MLRVNALVMSNISLLLIPSLLFEPPGKDGERRVAKLVIIYSIISMSHYEYVALSVFI